MRTSWPRAASIRPLAAIAATSAVLLLPGFIRAQEAEPGPTLQPFQADPEPAAPAATPVRRARLVKPDSPAGEPPVARGGGGARWGVYVVFYFAAP